MIRANQHIAVDVMIEIAKLFCRQVLQCGNNFAERNFGLHVGSNASARWNKWLKLFANLDQRISHGDHNLSS